MTEFPAEILDYYRTVDEGPRITEGFGRLELVRTREIVRRHLPAGPLRVLDVGGATGVHAAWLAADGHRVTLLDMVPEHVAAARRLAATAPGLTVALGDARALPVRGGGFDAVLLLGPLYHLTDRDERVLSLREALRAVRPGGLVFGAAISRFASLFSGLAEGFLFEPAFREMVRHDLAYGQHRNRARDPRWFTTAFFHHPGELRAECADAGLDVTEIAGVEGIAHWLPQLAERWGTPEGREVILDAVRAVETEPSLLGLSSHLLVTARRPG